MDFTFLVGCGFLVVFFVALWFWERQDPPDDWRDGDGKT